MTSSSATNMYRVGDYVYFEINSSSPFQIRRIEELNKTPTGSVEAKVMCFYRRRDIAPALLKLIDDRPVATTTTTTNSVAANNHDVENSDVNKTAEEEIPAVVIQNVENSPDSKLSDISKDEDDDGVPSPRRSKAPSPEAIDAQPSPRRKEDDAPVAATEDISKNDEEPMDTTTNVDAVDEKVEKQTDELKEQTDEVNEPKDEVSPQKDEVSPQKDEVKQQKDEVKQQKDELKQQKDELKQQKDEVKLQKDEVKEQKATNGGSGAETTAAESVVVVQPPVSAPKTAIHMQGEEDLTDQEKHKLLHRELFLSRQIETLPATHIRGKCSVTLLNEIETPPSYLGRDDMFFYSLVYDPAQKTLIADKGEIRIGDKYQAEIPDQLTDDEKENYWTDHSVLETMIFHPYHELTDRQLDQFIIIARAVGTFSRALDMSSSAKQPNLHLTAAAASRDVTPFQSMALLHQADYDLAKAMCFLVPPAHKQWFPIDADKATALNTATLGGPLMCRDQLEEWSAAEANLFDEALEKYGKDFNDIRQDFLPWKALRDIVEYYYMWKTTDRYVQQKRVKANEAESRLKQVYIPANTKPNPNVLSTTNPFTAQSNKCCEGCSIETCVQWYSWGPPGSLMRLCKECWTYWKKYGGLKRPHPLESFDKTSYPHPDQQVTGTVPRPSDRLEGGYDSSVRRCPVVGCARQFANAQLLNQHIRRDHFQCDDADGASPASNTSRMIASEGGGGGRVNASGGYPMPNRPGAPRTRASFYIRTTVLTKVARRLAPKPLLNVKRSARNPFDPINMLAIKQHCQMQPSLHIRNVLKALLKNAPPPSAVVQQPAAPTVISASNKQSPVVAAQPKSVKATAPPGTTFPQKRTHNGTSGWDGSPPSKRAKGDKIALKQEFRLMKMKENNERS